jgi:hypothetical protein
MSLALAIAVHATRRSAHFGVLLLRPMPMPLPVRSYPCLLGLGKFYSSNIKCAQQFVKVGCSEARHLRNPESANVE